MVVDWDMASPLRNLHPVEEDCPSHFADATKLQILDVATETVRRLRVSGCGESATTLPGLRIFCGSNACLTWRKTSYSWPYWRRT